MPGTCELFAGNNIRCTTQRRALYEALVATDSHPTAEELYRMVKPTTNRLSLATVYNTLETFCKVGLARKLPCNGCCRYDGDVSRHLHLWLREDGTIQDVPEELGNKLIRELPEAVIAEIARTLGVEIEGINIQLLARRPRPVPATRS